MRALRNLGYAALGGLVLSALLGWTILRTYQQADL